MKHSSCYVHKSTSYRELWSFVVGQNILDLINGYVLLNTSQVSPHNFISNAGYLQREIFDEIKRVQDVDEDHHYEHDELIGECHP